jgi:Mn2+/Fe2+ NRAMP family transporter
LLRRSRHPNCAHHRAPQKVTFRKEDIAIELSLLAYVGVAFSVQLDWPAALRSNVTPRIHWNKDYVTTVVAILGTTINPYLCFWQAEQEVEEIKRVPADKPLRIAPKQKKSTCGGCTSTLSWGWGLLA